MFAVLTTVETPAIETPGFPKIFNHAIIFSTKVDRAKSHDRKRRFGLVVSVTYLDRID